MTICQECHAKGFHKMSCSFSNKNQVVVTADLHEVSRCNCYKCDLRRDMAKRRAAQTPQP